MDFSMQAAMLKRLQAMEFVAVELNLYLDTHPCDQEAINDYNCAVQVLRRLKKEYEEQCGPLFNFGWSGSPRHVWRWAEGPWPWEI